MPAATNLMPGVDIPPAAERAGAGAAEAELFAALLVTGEPGTEEEVPSEQPAPALATDDADEDEAGLPAGAGLLPILDMQRAASVPVRIAARGAEPRPEPTVATAAPRTIARPEAEAIAPAEGTSPAVAGNAGIAQDGQPLSRPRHEAEPGPARHPTPTSAGASEQLASAAPSVLSPLSKAAPTAALTPEGTDSPQMAANAATVGEKGQGEPVRSGPGAAAVTDKAHTTAPAPPALESQQIKPAAPGASSAPPPQKAAEAPIGRAPAVAKTHAPVTTASAAPVATPATDVPKDPAQPEQAYAPPPRPGAPAKAAPQAPRHDVTPEAEPGIVTASTILAASLPAAQRMGASPDTRAPKRFESFPADAQAPDKAVSVSPRDPAALPAGAAKVIPSDQPLSERSARSAAATPSPSTPAPVSPDLSAAIAMAPTATPAAAPDPRAPLDLRNPAWTHQLARDLASAETPDGPLRLRLSPETLGKLSIEISQTDRGLQLKMTAETEAARAALVEAQPRLIADARAQGVRIAETQVEVAPQPRGETAGQPQQQQQQQNGQPQRDAAMSGGSGRQEGQPHQPGQSWRNARFGAGNHDAAAASGRHTSDRYA